MMRHLLLAGLGMAATLPLHAAGPLTRTPWGEPLWPATTADAGRGGTGLALMDSTRLGVVNPAAQHAGRLTRFQMDFSAARSHVSEDGLGQDFSSGSFDSWALAFPLGWKDMHAGLSLLSLSQADYLVTRSGVDSQARSYLESLRGKGGLSRAALTLSATSPMPSLRVGVEAGLVFGSLLEKWKLFYPASAPPYDSWVDTRHSLLGLQPRLGLQWQANPALSAGLVWAPSTAADLTVDRENRGNDQDQESAIRSAHLPGDLALGLAWRKGTATWLLDARVQDWSRVPMGSTVLEEDGRVDHPKGVALGVDLPASRDFNASWYRRTTWRAGLRWQEWYARRLTLRPDNSAQWNTVESLSLSLGAGIPLKAFGSWLDVAVEGGRSGDGSLDDQFVKLRMGLGARDLWFVRPRY